MEELGDYLYLIVFAIAGLSSLLKKRKKAKEVQEESQPTVYEQVLEEEEDWWNESNKPIEPKAQPVVVPVSSTPSYSTRDNLMGYESTSKYEEIKVRKQKISNIQFDTTEVDENLEEKEIAESIVLNLNDVDEAKTAFVYSEVFNRKY